MNDSDNLEISFLKDSFMTIDSSSSDHIQRLHFSNFASAAPAPSTPNSSHSSTKKRKRESNNTNNNTNTNTSPPNKRQRTSQPQSSSATSLHSIHENQNQKNAIQPPSNVAKTNTVDKNGKKAKTKSIPKTCQQPLRRSKRLQNKQKNTPISKSVDDDEINSNLNDSLNSISAPLSALKLSNKHKNKKNKNCNVRIMECKNKSNNNDGSEWNELLCNSVQSKWNAKKTPIQSSLKLSHKKQKRIPSSRKVNWGNVECRNYEQRCGILSCGVPSEYGPSLHLGKLLSETIININEYGKDNINNKSEIYNELPKKERIERVKQFCVSDLERGKLKKDREEIKLLQTSRIDIGCKCVSVYKMKKNEIIERILYLDDTNDKKVLNKLKKNGVFNMLIKLQFDKYGRYDVCCVDELCYCYKQGIECQIDNECCMCGGDVVYNNNLQQDEDESGKRVKGKVNKRNSLCCGNPNGNTLNVSVLDYIEEKDENENENKNEHDVVKKVKSTFLEFTSPFVQKRINEWKKHYDNVEECEDKKNKVQIQLNFD